MLQHFPSNHKITTHQKEQVSIMRGLGHEQSDTSASAMLHNTLNLENSTIKLPCDTFRSRFTFRIVTAFQYKWFALSWLCSLVLFLLFQIVSNETANVLILILYIYVQIFAIIFCFFVNTMSFLKFRMSLEDKMKFYSEIVNNTPYSNYHSWDVICYNMITYFKESGFPNSLYDGADCNSLFQVLLKDKKDVKSDTQNDTVEEESSSLTKDTTDKAKLVYLETAREKAHLVYLQSENSYWVNKYPELAP